MRSAAVLAIDGYRRFISPYKGFSCAHNRLHGMGSCSDFGRDVVQRYGVRQGIGLIRRRLQECKLAAGELQAMAQGSRSDHPEATEGEPPSKRRYPSHCDTVSNCDGVARMGGDCLSPRNCNAISCDGLPSLECGAPAGAIDLCSVGDACACGW